MRGAPALRPHTVGFVLSLLIAAVVGFVLAGQIITPNKRVIEVAMGLAVLVAAFLLPNRYAVAFMLFIIPFPQRTTMGSTTVIFAYLIFAFWLLKVALGVERRPIRSGLEVPIIIMFLLYFLSFQNVQPEHMRFAIANFRTLISSVLIFYLVVNLIRTERDIQFTLNALILSFGFVGVIAMIELWIPGFAPYLKVLHVSTVKEMSFEGVRVGSVFGDYEMFAEYLAIFIPILMIRILSEKVFLRQLIWIPFMMMAVMLLLGTATRGAFFSLIAGVIYLVWISRKILNLQKFLPLVILAAVVFYVSSIALNQYTESASLFARLGKTKLVSGMPDTRARVWTESWAKVLERPWIGHGPHYVLGWDEKHMRRHYPHSLFLFLSYLIGIPGALVFYYLLFKALRFSLKAAKRYATQRTEFAYTVVLLSSCLVIFLVDEIKICFLRYDQTQQFTWTMLGILVSASRLAIMLADRRESEHDAKRIAAHR